MAVSYNKNIDYSALMAEAIKIGDYKAAARYEQQRNAKIAGEGITEYKPTYDLGSVYDIQHMTNAELGKAYNSRMAYQSGQTDMSSSHSYVEGLRKNYGYSGGVDGSQYIPIQQTPTYQAPAYVSPYQSRIDSLTSQLMGSSGSSGSSQQQFVYDYEPMPTYTSRYQSQIDALNRQIMGRAAFSYNPETDPLYQQYRTDYTRSGQRAMQDTMGQLSARTGGMASSYAGSAAQQTYDGYMSALSGRIPELQQLAYEMYQDEGERQQAQLRNLQTLEQNDYNQYLNRLNQYNANRNFAYGTYRDQSSDSWRGLEVLSALEQQDYNRYRGSVEDARYAEKTAYDRDVQLSESAYDRVQQASQAVYDRNRYESETAYNRKQAESETAYKRQLQKAEQLAKSGDFSGYLDLGYTQEEVERMRQAYLMQHPELRYSAYYGAKTWN